MLVFLSSYISIFIHRQFSQQTNSIFQKIVKLEKKKIFAPGEARTHGLQIMRLTRCRLRYRGLVITYKVFCGQECSVIRCCYHAKSIFPFFLPKLNQYFYVILQKNSSRNGTDQIIVWIIGNIYRRKGNYNSNSSFKLKILISFGIHCIKQIEYLINFYCNFCRVRPRTPIVLYLLYKGKNKLNSILCSYCSLFTMSSKYFLLVY